MEGTIVGNLNMSNHDQFSISQQNSKKLDLLLEQMQILTKQCGKHETLLYGEEGKLGMAQKFRIMWGVHVWVLMILSGALGSLVTAMIMRTTLNK